VLSQFKNHGEEAVILFMHYDKNVSGGVYHLIDSWTMRTQVAYTGSGNRPTVNEGLSLVNTASEDDPSESVREVLQAHQQGRMSMDDLVYVKTQ
jgi:hypothetical protein